MSTKEYCLEVKRNRSVIKVTELMNFKYILLRERIQCKYFPVLITKILVYKLFR